MEASASVLQPPHPFCLFSHIHIASCPNGGSSGISPLPSAHKLSLMSSIFLSLWINHFEKQEYRMFTYSRNCHMLHDRKGGAVRWGSCLNFINCYWAKPRILFLFFFCYKKIFPSAHVRATERQAPNQPMAHSFRCANSGISVAFPPAWLT